MRGIIQQISLAILSVCCLPVMAQTAGKPDGPLVSEPVGTGDFVQMFLGLLLVLGIIFGMAWLIRRMGSFQQMSHGALRVLGGLSVGQRERIVLIQVGEQQLLIGLAPGHIRTLHVLEQPVTINQAKGEAGGGFAERLQAALQGKVKT